MEAAAHLGEELQPRTGLQRRRRSRRRAHERRSARGDRVLHQEGRGRFSVAAEGNGDLPAQCARGAGGPLRLQSRRQLHDLSRRAHPARPDGKLFRTQLAPRRPVRKTACARGDQRRRFVPKAEAKPRGDPARKAMEIVVRGLKPEISEDDMRQVVDDFIAQRNTQEALTAREKFREQKDERRGRPLTAPSP
jgi:hypothetical protein